MTLFTRMARTAKKHPAGFVCRVLLGVPLTVLITVLNMARLIADALHQGLRKLFPHEN